MHNGLCEKGEWPHTIITKKQTKKHTHKRFIPSSKVLMCDSENYILFCISVLNPKIKFFTSNPNGGSDLDFQLKSTFV